MAEDKYMEEAENGIIKSDDEEIANLEKNISLHEETLEDTKKRKELTKEFQEVVRNNPRKLNPEFEYQNMDKFWELHTKLIELQHKQELNKIDLEIERLEKTIKDRKEKLESLKGGKNE